MPRTPARTRTVVLDGNRLSIEDLVRVARDPRVRIALDPDAMARVARCRKLIEDIVRDYGAAIRAGRPERHVYGVTTGFGEFKDLPVPPEDLARLQENLLRSHAAGGGDSAQEWDPANFLPADVVRATLVIRVNAFLKGHSGVRPAVVRTVAAMVNAGIVPLVPAKGSLGSSGDLCPLAHLFSVLLGEGAFHVVAAPADIGFRPDRPGRGGTRNLRGAPVTLHPARALARHLAPALAALGGGRERRPARPGHKESLALINGATVSAALLALSVHDGEALADAADAAAALTCEAIGGHTRAFDPAVHEVRNLAGQKRSAARLLALLDGSRLADRARSPQDAYSVRCAPQVHGASRDALAYARAAAEAEINAATDNPLFFPGHAGCDVTARRARGERAGPGDDPVAFSAGNFHGQPLALAADFLAIAVAEFANISERRTQMLLDRNHSRNLPPNLTAAPGVNSGFMIAQYAAASLVSENKVLAHPASVDSIPTSANAEDHVAMATLATRKARTVLANTETVLAIELLVAAQAVEWRAAFGLDPNRPPPAPRDPIAAAAQRLARFRSAVRRRPSPAVVAALGQGTRAAYAAVRALVPSLLEDRALDADIRAIRRLVASGALSAAGEPAFLPESPAREA